MATASFRFRIFKYRARMKQVYRVVQNRGGDVLHSYILVLNAHQTIALRLYVALRLYM